MNSRYGPVSVSGALVWVAVAFWVIAQFLLVTEAGAQPVSGFWATLLGWAVEPVAWSANVWFVAALTFWAFARYPVAGLLAALAVLCSAPWVAGAAQGVAVVCSALWFHGPAESQCATVGLGPYLWLAAFVVLVLAVGAGYAERRLARQRPPA